MRLQKIDRLVGELFEKKWKNLHDSDALEDAELKFPGVYMLAYSGKKLSGKKVRCDDVLYVGMSNSVQGVRDRLDQFKRGIEGQNYHSGAKVFPRSRQRTCIQLVKREAIFLRRTSHSLRQQ